MKSKAAWNGTVSELLWVLRDAYTPPNTAAKLPCKYSLELYKEHGIRTCFSRTGRKRIVTLQNNYTRNQANTTKTA